MRQTGMQENGMNHSSLIVTSLHLSDRVLGIMLMLPLVLFVVTTMMKIYIEQPNTKVVIFYEIAKGLAIAVISILAVMLFLFGLQVLLQ